MPVYWRFVLKTDDKVNLGAMVYLVEETTKEKKQIVFRNGAEIQMGPYYPEVGENKVQKTYRLMLLNTIEGTSTLIGPKFGFLV